jgi:putative PEP-CTERM system histidine kinase
MNIVGLLSYAIGGATFLILSGLLFAKWRASREAVLLVVATSTTTFWALLNAYTSLQQHLSFLILALELCRSATWSLFLLYLLQKSSAGIPRSIQRGIIIVGLVAILVGIVSVSRLGELITEPNKYYSTSMLVISLIGIVLIEQLYRNASKQNRWAIKFLCVGAGGMFIYDMFLYSSTLLFQQIDYTLWSARGIVFAFIAPLIAISAARNPNWSVTPYVSRHVVFYSASLFAAGTYMLLMAVSGYYIKIHGGTWGAVLQVIFSFGAILVLFVVMLSDQLKSRFKRFLVEHFYSNKYDYREEWLRLMRILSDSSQELTTQQRVLKAIAQIVESPAGILWINNSRYRFDITASWNVNVKKNALPICDKTFLNYLELHHEVINMLEYQKYPERYSRLVLPDTLKVISNAWLIVPIIHQQRLYGIVLLTKSGLASSHTWEDSELLQTVGQQVASYLAQEDAAKKLAENKQFETFNRLSAFIVHDLKNIIAQLELVVTNSKKHTNNPAFMSDAIKTVDNTVRKMNYMLGQLKNKAPGKTNLSVINLDIILSSIIANRSKDKPVPRFVITTQDIRIYTEKDRLKAVIEHLIQNAQQATNDKGEVTITLSKNENNAILEIQDNGCGMDSEFIQKRLFKPFDTTKGNAGMGLGAYESQQYVHELGGEIAVNSTVGEGTLITLLLPLYEGHTDRT